MKITREIFDNDKQIIHVNYEKKDLKKIEKRIREIKKKYEEDLKKIEEEINRSKEGNSTAAKTDKTDIDSKTSDAEITK